MLEDVKVVFNGQKLLVQNVEVSYNCGDLPSVSVEALIPLEEEKKKEPESPYKYHFGMDMGFRENDATFEMKVIQNEDTADALAYLLNGAWDNNIKLADGAITTAKENKNMKDREETFEKTCEDRSGYSHRLAKKLVDLELDDEEKLIRKYNLLHEDGTLTASGRELLLTLLFKEYRDEVVEALNEFEKEYKKKDSCEEC